MKNYKIYFLVFLLPLFFASCKKFLDRTPAVALDEDGVFADPIQAARYADNAYNYMINDYVRFNDHRGCVAQASDEAVSGNSESTVTTLNKGLYHEHTLTASLNDIRDVWIRQYAGIAITNKVLARMGEVPVNESIFPKDRVKGEMYFLRAFSYFELIKRFGGVPLIDKTYTIEDDVNFPRNTYEECVNFILADIEKALPILKTDADNGASNYGRATIGAALALKARVLLYAASPLNNPTGDKNKWKLAADAAQAVMGLGYSLQATYADLLNVASSTEYIMIKIKGPRPLAGNMEQDFSMSPGSGGAQGQMNPTQNHVDMYEMANGKPISDATSGYNAQNPYAGREPRFYANIIYNDLAWQGRKIGMWSQTVGTTTTYGLDYNPAITYTATRYYCKKYWPETYRTTGGGTTLINYIFFRYAEILLNYAEAQNEYLDAPDASVYAQLVAIRKRAGIAQGTGVYGYGLKDNMTKLEMQTVIRHERAIELAFEDHRWYDIMRWKIGPQVIATPMYGMNVIKKTDGTFTYNPFVLDANFQKTYTSIQDRYPIPRTEIYKSKGVLVQNPGWE